MRISHVLLVLVTRSKVGHARAHKDSLGKNREAFVPSFFLNFVPEHSLDVSREKKGGPRARDTFFFFKSAYVRRDRCGDLEGADGCELGDEGGVVFHEVAEA